MAATGKRTGTGGSARQRRASARADVQETVEEHVLGEEPVVEPHEPFPWQDHDWTVEEIKFVSRYLTHGGAARAYREVHNIQRDTIDWLRAQQNGLNWLKRPHMAAYVAELRAEMMSRMAVTRERVTEELARMAFANMADFYVLQEDGTSVFDLSGLTADQTAAISELTIETYHEGKGEYAVPVKSTRIKLAPKISAVELLGKTMKMFTDVVEGPQGDLMNEMAAAKQRRREARKRGEDNDE